MLPMPLHARTLSPVSRGAFCGPRSTPPSPMPPPPIGPSVRRESQKGSQWEVVKKSNTVKNTMDCVWDWIRERRPWIWEPRPCQKVKYSKNSQKH